jgi:hypothetical protein
MARTIPPHLRDLRRLPCRLAPSGKIPLIGVLRPVAADDPHTEAFRQGLRELGYVEGHNVHMAYRFAEGRFERLPTLADEWVRLPVDVLVTARVPWRPGKRPTRSRSSSPIRSPRGWWAALTHDCLS